MSAISSEKIGVLLVDDRATAKLGDRYPHSIFLSAALRFAVCGYYSSSHIEELGGLEKIIRNNDSAIISVGSLLAKGLESGAIDVFNEHSRLCIDGTEKEALISRLKVMNRANNFSGLVEIDALDYSLDGQKLYHFIAENVQPVDPYLRGGLWGRLAGDAPYAWGNHHPQPDTNANQSDIPHDNVDDEQPPAPKVESVKGITKQQVIAAFEGLHFDTDAKWSKALADVPAWLEPCRVMKGIKGKNSISATWNPVLIAVALYEKGIPRKKLDAAFVGLKDWTDKWQEASEIFR